MTKTKKYAHFLYKSTKYLITWETALAKKKVSVYIRTLYNVIVAFNKYPQLVRILFILKVPGLRGQGNFDA